MYVTSSSTLWPVSMEENSSPLIVPRSEEGMDLLLQDTESDQVAGEGRIAPKLLL